MTNDKMPQLFRILGIILAFSAVLPFSTDTAVFAAPPYPSKTVRLIVPYAAGGSVDIIARLLSTKLSERLGKQVIVDNHGGASSIIGTEMVAKADPDGYTLLIATTAHGIHVVRETRPPELPAVVQQPRRGNHGKAAQQCTH